MTSNLSRENSIDFSSNDAAEEPSNMTNPRLSNKRRLPTTGAIVPVPSPATSPSKKHKRPYRRTKRPPNYCDKSTLTTVTTTSTQPNAYTAVLAESADLLQAASEAQQLGRLSMASGYLLLLHARLVGLGKLFDRSSGEKYEVFESPTRNGESPGVSSLPPSHSGKASSTPNRKDATPVALSTLGDASWNPEIEDSVLNIANTPENLKVTLTSATPNCLPPRSSPLVLQNGTPEVPKGEANDNHQVSSAPDLVSPRSMAARQFAQMLPGNVELDTDMMEFLAQKASELQAARSKKHLLQQHESSAVTTHEFLAMTANQRGLVTHNNTSPVKDDDNKKQQKPASSGKKKNPIISWQRPAAMESQLARGKSLSEVAHLTGRTEHQVQAYFRNQKTRSAPLPEDFVSRRPLTTAINTVPNALCDARQLVQGGVLKSVVAGDSPTKEIDDEEDGDYEEHQDGDI